MGMVAPVYYTADMVRALPVDGKRYETVRGELLVTPTPRAWHQEVLQRLNRQLGDFLAESAVGHLFLSPADISWSHDTLVQPDLFVVDLEEARTMDWTEMQTLLLVIEVLSPATARYDRFTKRGSIRKCASLRTGLSIPTLDPWRYGRRTMNCRRWGGNAQCGIHQAPPGR